jgi:ABC-2 type transport system ATP-binding protein
MSIFVRGLVKRYGDVDAVDGIDLTARPGTCVGLLGPNGAGKTTTIEILEGLRDADAGEVRVLDLSWKDSARAIRARIGVQLQETRLPDKLTVFETLRVFRSFYESGRDPDEVVRLIGLEEKRDARLATLSGGQRQRLALGCALVNHPDILFLDEPTTGLDPQARRQVWSMVREFKERGGTVLLTTHYMDEAEQLADDLVIIDHGRIIAQGSPQEVVRSLRADGVIRFSLETRGGEPVPGLADEELQRLPGVRSVQQRNGATTLTVEEPHRTLPALLDAVRGRDWVLADLQTHRATLDDVFLSITGRHLEDA